jgi:predicted O-methyltransferase YrrM
MWKLGPEKGRILESIIKQRDPAIVVEVGTFLGYSAIRTARTLNEGGRLFCVEGSPEYASGLFKANSSYPSALQAFLISSYILLNFN